VKPLLAQLRQPFAPHDGRRWPLAYISFPTCIARKVGRIYPSLFFVVVSYRAKKKEKKEIR
jgi:hypothetical protein